MVAVRSGHNWRSGTPARPLTGTDKPRSRPWCGSLGITRAERDPGRRSMVTIELTSEDEAKVEEFSGNLFMACLATMELANVELGVRLGLYEALAGAGAVTAAELATGAGISPRY